ncbi:11902_t:CDS:2 [Funneliformis caledonium]|uniref:11902_t:CDS:1 n=1 Tax=Funneliformis caledonium TaxID=1117310 RepID=A0A9N9CZ88_9GLOM|nr:11902_t:CDS:2 [Funneliformis caledonium]
MASLIFRKEFSEVDYNSLQQSIILWSRLVAKLEDYTKKNELQITSLESVLNDDLFAELERVYYEELNCAEHLTSRKVEYYKSISYTIVNKDNQLDITLRIQTIFIHTKRQFDISFLLLDWFIPLEVDDPKLGCPCYRLQ